MNDTHMPAEYIAQRAGTRKWVLAARLTDKLRQHGYEAAIHRATWKRWQGEYANSLPRCPHCHQVLL